MSTNLKCWYQDEYLLRSVCLNCFFAGICRHVLLLFLFLRSFTYMSMRIYILSKMKTLAAKSPQKVIASGSPALGLPGIGRVSQLRPSLGLPQAGIFLQVLTSLTWLVSSVWADAMFYLGLGREQECCRILLRELGQVIIPLIPVSHL